MTDMNTDDMGANTTANLSDNTASLNEPSTPTGSGFSGNLRGIWRSRPVRIPASVGGRGWFGGICEGIATRYFIDPTLVRIAFIVGAFFGAGIPLYFLLWAILPRLGATVSPVEIIFNPRGIPADTPAKGGERMTGVLTLIAMAITLSLVPLTSTLMTALVAAAAIVLLHQHQPTAPKIVPSAPLANAEASTVTLAPPRPDNSMWILWVVLGIMGAGILLVAVVTTASFAYLGTVGPWEVISRIFEIMNKPDIPFMF